MDNASSWSQQLSPTTPQAIYPRRGMTFLFSFHHLMLSPVSDSLGGGIPLQQPGMFGKFSAHLSMPS